MSILSVDTIQPIGSGSTVTLNAAKIVVGTGITFESNGQAIYAGIITATSFSGSGANLTSLPAANITGTLPAISGANLTSLPAQATLNNNADNRVITGGSGVNLYAESGFTYDGTIVQIPDRINLNTTGTYIKSNQIAFNPTGTAYLDHYRTGQDIQIRMSTSSSLDTTGPTFKSNGNLAFASGKGIDFSASGNAGGMTSELLDDYEEGIHVIQPSGTSNFSISNSYDEAPYTKIGRLVTIRGLLYITAHSGSDYVRVTMPFTAATDSAGVRYSGNIGAVMHNNVNTGDCGVVAYMSGASNRIGFYKVSDSAGWSHLITSDLAVGAEIYFTLSYEV